MYCLKCDEDIEPEEFPFGDDVTCDKCGAVHETDWDYTDAYEGDMSWWVTGLKEADNGPD